MDCMPENREWDDDGAITFQMRERIAWEINELAEEEDYSWACFAPALSAKLNDFCWRIVWADLSPCQGSSRDCLYVP